MLEQHTIGAKHISMRRYNAAIVFPFPQREGAGVRFMRCSVRLPTDRVDLGTEFVSSDGVMEVAKAAEAAGFDAVHVTDHPAPYDEWLRTGGHQALDPFVALSFAAAATTRLRLLTHIYVLPYRNPLLSARSVASIDALSKGRFLFGLAAGYLEAEFAALGVDFAERNELTDEAIRVMKAMWTQDGVHFKGKHFTADGHTIRPRPVQKPHPPIWVGGNSKIAIRRAVELCDGWMPFPNNAKGIKRRHTPPMETPGELKRGVAYAHEHAKAVSRKEPLDIIVTIMTSLNAISTPKFSAQAVVEHIAQLKAAGATYMVLGLPGESRKQLLKNVDLFGHDVLSRLPK